jgi:drug/metabolite transporter superfamily protein YnfA
MERLAIVGGLFVLAGLCEIGGGYLVWGWMRENKPVLWVIIGAAVLVTGADHGAPPQRDRCTAPRTPD